MRVKLVYGSDCPLVLGLTIDEAKELCDIIEGLDGDGPPVDWPEFLQGLRDVLVEAIKEVR